MPDAYQLHEVKFVQRDSNGSGADALAIGISAVPAGRVRTILSAYAFCSVTETQDYWFSIQSMGAYWPITLPASRVITPAVSRWAPMLLEGMEIKLFPGEVLTAHRAAATAGSSISIAARFIETDLPLYEYHEPQMVKRLRRSATSLIYSSRRGGGGGIIGGPGSGPAPPTGGGGPLPV